MTIPTTFERNQTMTAQDMFDISATHLLTQGRRSVETSERCRYRHPNGDMCAFGPFIPEDRYNRAMEGQSCISSDLWKATGLPNGLRELALRLQHCHDDGLVEEWPMRLAVIAKQFGLSPAVVHAHKEMPTP